MKKKRPISDANAAKLITLGIVFIVIGSTAFVFRGNFTNFIEEQKQRLAQKNLPEEQSAEEFIKPESQIEEPIPEEINLNVPFTSQAPFANWSLPYQEACEEASSIMVNAFYEKKSLSKNEADKQILALVDFQTKTYGFYKDTTAEEVARFMKSYWGYESVRVLPTTADGIKRELANGSPVIIPAAGRQLGNPNFTRPGPVYHMLVVKGYTRDGKFITNDPGTRRGENYVYTEKTVLNANHDWNGGNVTNGEKLMIVVDPIDSKK